MLLAVLSLRAMVHVARWIAYVSLQPESISDAAGWITVWQLPVFKVILLPECLIPDGSGISWTG
jgi:hypothetical protein